jgi:hypothetical protein
MDDRDKIDPEKNHLMEYWAHNRRKWYLLYFYLGVGVNFLLYFTKPYGFDPSGSILWGSFFGLAIPLATMCTGVWVHKKIIGL